MKKSTRLLIGCLVVSLAVFWTTLFIRSREHPLAKSIGLEVVDDTHEDSINRSIRALIFSKEGVDYDLYAFICGKASAMYSDENFKEGIELNSAQNFSLISSEYSHGQRRAFEIRSKDDYAGIAVVEYDEYVVIVLYQGRI